LIIFSSHYYIEMKITTSWRD